jgi:hypothetical protein
LCSGKVPSKTLTCVTLDFGETARYPRWRPVLISTRPPVSSDRQHFGCEHYSIIPQLSLRFLGLCFELGQDHGGSPPTLKQRRGKRRRFFNPTEPKPRRGEFNGSRSPKPRGRDTKLNRTISQYQRRSTFRARIETT